MQEPYTTFRHNLQYSTIFECRVLHEYFAEERCPVLEISPTAATAALMSGMGLLFRPLADGFVIIADISRDWSNPMYQRPEVFEFGFKVKDPQFIRYTDVPYRSGLYFVFDTLSGTDGALHPSPFAAQDCLADVDVDGVGGMIRLHHTAEFPFLPKPSQSPSSEPDTHPVRFIRFASRMAILRYMFMGKSQNLEGFHNFFVENFEINGQLYTFTVPQVVSHRSGHVGFQILSTEPLALKQSYSARGMLRRKRVDGLPFEYRKTLPMPRPENLMLDILTDRYVCEMLVNL